MAKAKAKPNPDARQPWMKFFGRDWRSDPPLRMCSYAARGLWADILTLMHESRVIGFLLIEGVIPSTRQLAGLLGGGEKEIAKLAKELGAANVYSVTGRPMPEDVAALVPADMPNGVMLSRRMVRDKAKLDRDRANGRDGGNPNLTAPDNPQANPSLAEWVNPQANPQSQSQKLESERIREPLPGLPLIEESESSRPVSAREGLGGPAHGAVSGLTAKMRVSS